MRIVFMGTPDYAVPSLKKLIEYHEVVGIFTQPDKPKGRGQKLQITPIKEIGLNHNISVFQPKRLREDIEGIDFLLKVKPDAIIVVAYGQILPKHILEIPKYGCINAHASLLPKFRGAAPINWAIIKGEKITGVTTMLMDTGLDTGDILLTRETEIYDGETAEELHDILMNMSADLLLETLEKLAEGSIIPKKQDNTQSSYAPIMKKELGHIDFNKSNEEVYNLIRGVTPWPGAYCYYNNKMLKIWKCEKADNISKGHPGEILDVKKDGILVECRESSIILKEIQEIGGKKMDIASYLNGHNINKGDYFN